ncbi:hypothetical protein NPIL_33721 [Nephila pilipes]|uniref:Uncharacterized protein n=1 Tax=Nephila pilipes TaxID=299642 RepID=A0A8X6QZJ6_NEPPI|nr:hypothetical protein NPIL_33721 [Nephila pilipes]
MSAINLVSEELSYRIWIQNAHEELNKLAEFCATLDGIMFSVYDVERKLNNTQIGIEYLEPYIHRLQELVIAGDAVIKAYNNIHGRKQNIKRILLRIYIELERLQSKTKKSFASLNLKKRESEEILNDLQTDIGSIIGNINGFLDILNAITNDYFH